MAQARNLIFGAVDLKGDEAVAQAKRVLARQSGGDPKAALLLLLQAKEELLRNNFIVRFKPHDKQREFFALGKNKTRRAFFAGNRVGKTVTGAAEVTYHVTGMYPDWWEGHRFERPVLAWVAAKSKEKLIEGVQRMLMGPANGLGQGFIPKHHVKRVIRMQNVPDGIMRAYIRYKDTDQESVIVFKSYEQDRKAFETDRVDLIWLDEEPDYDIYRECTMRLLGTKTTAGGIMLLTFTPLTGMTQVCRVFLSPSSDEETGNGHVVASWQDNPYLDEAEVDELRRSTPDHEREAREFGRPVLGSGMIYPVAEAHYRVDPFPIPNHYRRGIGLDHGWTHPAAIAWWARDPNTGICYLYSTWRASKTPIPVMASLLKGNDGYIPIFSDPSGEAGRQEAGGASIHDQYSREGVFCQAADNQVEAGLIELLNDLIAGRLKVFSTATHWWDEVRTYQRDDKGAVVKEFDDLMDAARYGYRHRGAWISKEEMMRPLRRPKASSWKST